MVTACSDELKQDNKWHPGVLIELTGEFYITSSLEAAEKEIGERLSKEGVNKYKDIQFNWNRGKPLILVVP